MKYEQTCTTKRMSWHTVGSVCQRRVERAINPVQGDGLCIGRHCHCLDSSTEHSHQHFTSRVHNCRNTISTGANTPYRARLTAMSTVNRRVCAGAITSAVEIANRYLCMLRAWESSAGSSAGRLHQHACATSPGIRRVRWKVVGSADSAGMAAHSARKGAA